MDTREDDHEEGELGPGARSVPAHLQRLAVDAALQVEAAAEKFSQRLPTFPQRGMASSLTCQSAARSPTGAG